MLLQTAKSTEVWLRSYHFSKKMDTTSMVKEWKYMAVADGIKQCVMMPQKQQYTFGTVKLRCFTCRSFL